MNSKVDPIRDAYFRPLEIAEAWSGYLFYATAIISIGILFVDAAAYGVVYAVAQGAFVVLAVSGSALGLGISLYWAPRAADKRASDFVANAFDVNLMPEKTQHYYNNKEADPIRKAAMQLLENTFFTRNIARKMCISRRAVVASYAVAWVIVVTYRSSSLDLLIVVSQVLFSEEMISSLCRLEWLRARAEKTFDSMYRQIGSNKVASHNFTASVIEALVCYEIVKATSNVTLSSSVFEKNNERWSQEWESLRTAVGGK